jgi:hypothetical protein
VFLFSIFLLISLESKTTDLLLSPPIYKNQKLEQWIKLNGNNLELDLGCLDLTDDDMKIVGYYLLRNNKVCEVLFVFSYRREEKNFLIFHSNCEIVKL